MIIKVPGSRLFWGGVGILVVAAYTNSLTELAKLLRQVAPPVRRHPGRELRQGEERAKAERSKYSGTFTTASTKYVIQRVSGDYLEYAQLPLGVAAQASDAVTFDEFGVPLNNTAHTLTLQNGAGARTAAVGAQARWHISP